MPTREQIQEVFTALVANGLDFCYVCVGCGSRFDPEDSTSCEW